MGYIVGWFVLCAICAAWFRWFESEPEPMPVWAWCLMLLLGPFVTVRFLWDRVKDIKL